MQRSKGDSVLVRDLNQDLGHFAPLDEHGQALNLKQYQGKLVVVDFWATWCGSCLLAMKQLDALQKQHAEQLVIVAADQDPETTRSQARRYLDKMGYKFVLVYDDDSRRAIRVPFVPARLLLDLKGRLRFMELGVPNSGELLMEEKVSRLLHESDKLPVKLTGN
jgi:thiol-disulfide isomerase/thioredoxin